MFWLPNIVVCYGREEDHLPSELSFSPIDASTGYWDMVKGGKSARESGLEEEQDKSDTYHLRKSTNKWRATHSTTPIRRALAIGVSRRAQFSVLDDWATALHAYHVKEGVHGNLTPQSVGIVHGRGTLRRPSRARLTDCRELCPDDDVRGARWAAAELFRVDNGNPSPTKMSDVYSFACLMLQVLTGEVPYCGTNRSEQVVYLKYLGREPIDSQTPEVADHYVAFMRWCWSPDPEKRPTMETVVNFVHEEIKRLGEQRG